MKNITDILFRPIFLLEKQYILTRHWEQNKAAVSCGGGIRRMISPLHL